MPTSPLESPPRYPAPPWRGLRLVMYAALLLLVACSSLRTDYVKRPSVALAAPTATPTTRYVESRLASHGDQSGFRLLVDNSDALMSRVTLADHATHSIDLQYYIFDNDATGRLVMQRLLAAADRGVRVRLLVDDLDVDDAAPMLDALDAHANIEVRLFNPFNTRSPSMLSKAGQFLLDFRRLNRRMHNKAFIVDNSVSIVGGRNIGDAYFSDGDNAHFRDLDVIAIGPVVAETSRAFDAYWNDEAAVPVTAFSTPQALAQLRPQLDKSARALARSDYAAALTGSLPGGAGVERPGQWLWGDAAMVADEPEKIELGRHDPRLRIGPQVKATIDKAEREVLLISPYFVPTDDGLRYLTTLTQRGVKVKVLTNSLAATDEPMVHAGYARHRRDLLRGGIELHELRPLVPQQPSAHGRSSGVSLHAKAIVVDRRYVFVGSMNMDLRSKLLNTEMGVIVDSPALAEAAGGFFDEAIRPDNAFQVVLRRTASGRVSGLQWQSDDKGGQPHVDDHEPGVSALRRFEVDLLRVLPIDGML
ncbi:MAG: phospholipase D family protein [Dokdonella sp.]